MTKKPIDHVGEWFVASLGIVFAVPVTGVVGLVGFWIVRGFGRVVGAW